MVCREDLGNFFPVSRVMHLSSSIPGGGGGTPGKYNFIWGLYGRFERLFYPGGGGNDGGLVSKSLAPGGKQGTL